MWMVVVCLLVQAAIPKFEDFAAHDPLKGPPAQPLLRTPWQRTYRTQIRIAAKEKPNFAGHFRIAEWGCGSSCAGIAIIDQQTGTVYDGPFHIVAFPMAMTYPDDSAGGALAFKLESRLFVVRGCPEETGCGSYFYEWTGSGFKLLRKIPAVESH